MHLMLTLLIVAAGVGPVRGNFTPHRANSEHLIELRTRTIDTRTEEILSFEDANARRFIVHFDHRLSQADRQVLESYGLLIESYLPHSAYLVYGSPQAARDLAARGVIDWFGAYLASDKLHPELNDKTEPTKVSVTLFKGEDLDDVIYALQELGALIEDASENAWNGTILAWMNPEMITRSAELESVRWIEAWHQPVLFNDLDQWVLQTWEENNRRVWDMGLHGEGIIGSTCDSGIYTDHVMFADSTVAIDDWGDYPDHRKVIAYKRGSLGATFGDTPGASYHGTHTAGTVCGNDGYWSKDSPYDGIAPETRLYFVDIGASGIGVYPPGDLRDMYTWAHDGNAAGSAKFSSNSWGTFADQDYTVAAWQNDQFMWDHPGFVILYAAGNQGSYIAPQATAKNIVTVGATFNGVNANTVAGFSGGGPTNDGRIKPDVMAPGDGTSSLTGLWSASGSGTESYQQIYGTSMACPGGAGAVALLTQYLREGWYPTGTPDSYHDGFDPSAALIKAMLINSTTADFGFYTIPGSRIGWGRITLDSVFYFAGDERKLYLDENTDGLQTGDVTGYEVGINNDNRSLRVTLVWTDAPPELSADKQIVNNLDLEVRSPDGKVYLGNNFSANYSVTGGDPDEINVVEVVRIEEPTPGTWSVKVKATEIPQGPQPFALVISGNLEYHDINLEPAGLVIDDAGAADENKALDPGETVILYPIVLNNGSFTAQNVTGTLSSSSDDITIFTDNADYGSIQEGQSSQGTGFTVTASTNLNDEDVISFTLDLEANQGNYVRTLEYLLTIGLGVDESNIKPILSMEVMNSPFAEHLGVRLHLTEPGAVRLIMCDESGRVVRTLLDNSRLQAGVKEYTFSATDQSGNSLPSGVYFVRLITEENQLTCKGLRIK